MGRILKSYKIKRFAINKTRIHFDNKNFGILMPK